jgi:hypothetical protein
MSSDWQVVDPVEQGKEIILRRKRKGKDSKKQYKRQELVLGT